MRHRNKKWPHAIRDRPSSCVWCVTGRVVCLMCDMLLWHVWSTTGCRGVFDRPSRNTSDLWHIVVTCPISDRSWEHDKLNTDRCGIGNREIGPTKKKTHTHTTDTGTGHRVGCHVFVLRFWSGQKQVSWQAPLLPGPRRVVLHLTDRRKTKLWKIGQLLSAEVYNCAAALYIATATATYQAEVKHMGGQARRLIENDSCRNGEVSTSNIASKNRGRNQPKLVWNLQTGRENTDSLGARSLGREYWHLAERTNEEFTAGNDIWNLTNCFNPMVTETLRPSMEHFRKWGRNTMWIWTLQKMKHYENLGSMEHEN